MREGLSAAPGWTPRDVFQLAKNPEGRLYLDHLASGVRHRPAGATQPTVYGIAHRRLNG